MKCRFAYRTAVREAAVSAAGQARIELPRHRDESAKAPPKDQERVKPLNGLRGDLNKRCAIRMSFRLTLQSKASYTDSRTPEP
jgi:hypothetical protein